MPETGVIARPQLVLASASPNRRRLLEQVGITPVVTPADLDETPKSDESETSLVERLAIEKASAVASGKDLVVGADTVIVDGDEVMGKPADRPDAERMLRQLNDGEHRVLTGVAVVCNGRSRSSVTETFVRFRQLDGATINWYLELGEWVGKAGAYAIQGSGSLLVDAISGDYHNVVGLPLTALDRLLDGFGRPLRTWAND